MPKARSSAATKVKCGDAIKKQKAKKSILKESAVESEQRSAGAFTTCELDKKLMRMLFEAEGCEVVQHAKGELTVLNIMYGSPAFNMWKEHYLPGGKEPRHLDDSDPIFSPVAHYGPGLAIPPHLHYGVGQVLHEFLFRHFGFPFD